MLLNEVTKHMEEKTAMEKIVKVVMMCFLFIILIIVFVYLYQKYDVSSIVSERFDVMQKNKQLQYQIENL